MTIARCKLAALTVAGLLVACRSNSDQVVFQLQADRFASSEWSEPVNLGPVVNSSALDANAGLSSDAHTLFFVSTRTGGLGNLDIWVTHRRCLACDWEVPVNLGAPINSDAMDAAPTMSEDGRLLFFYSARAGGLGLSDIYVSHRVSTGADGDVWGPPVNLGPDANTAASEQGTFYVHEPGEPNAFVYFNRPTAGGSIDVYRVAVSNDGDALGPAVLVPELSDPTTFDQKVAVSTDGHELLLSSLRAGGFGNLDIWRFTRQSARDPWSNATHVDAPINTSDLDSQPVLSRDGRTLIFTSNRAGGLGQQDLWMSTRSPGGL
jgi:WD40-like Beta Propeller Repeat